MSRFNTFLPLLVGIIAAWLALPVRATAAPAPLVIVNSIAEMLAMGDVKTPAVQVLSYRPGVGQGGGLFVWNATRADATDNCTIFAPANAPRGRWIRQLQSSLNVTMCGAYWDGIHDDAAALDNAFKVAAALHSSLELPGGTGKICSTVTAAPGVVVRGQGMGTAGAVAASATFIDANCMRAGWVFEFLAPKGTIAYEAPKFYDMSIRNGLSNAVGGCIRWNSAGGGFTDSAATQGYVLHPHAERVYCEMNNNASNQQIGFQCSKCFDGDISQSETRFGKDGADLEGSDVMCVGCAGPNRFAGSNDSLVRLSRHGTFGNRDRVVGNEILSPADFGQPYDSMIYDATRSSTIESNHIEGAIKGGQSAIHLLGGSHGIRDNDVEVFTVGGTGVPHWLIANGPFITLQVFNNGCFGCLLNPALFDGPASQPNYNLGGVRQVITHGGNASNGDSGFPFNVWAPK